MNEAVVGLRNALDPAAAEPRKPTTRSASRAPSTRTGAPSYATASASHDHVDSRLTEHPDARRSRCARRCGVDAARAYEGDRGAGDTAFGETSGRHQRELVRRHRPRRAGGTTNATRVRRRAPAPRQRPDPGAVRGTAERQRPRNGHARHCTARDEQRVVRQVRAVRRSRDVPVGVDTGEPAEGHAGSDTGREQTEVEMAHRARPKGSATAAGRYQNCGSGDSSSTLTRPSPTSRA